MQEIKSSQSKQSKKPNSKFIFKEENI